MAPLERDLQAIRGALNIFGLASGLFSNLEKSVATPMHCSEDDVARVVSILSYRIENFPLRYLGIPLSVYKLKRSEEQPLIDKIAARIPGWKGNLLNMAGRTALVKAILSAIPIHTSIALCLSPWAIDTIDRLRRGFVWAGSSTVAGGRCRVSWLIVCRPRELGGLGISDLRCTGVTLRVRWVWRDRCNGRWPRTTERAALAIFQAATTFSLGNGESMYFWTDRWINGFSIEYIAPTIFATVSARKRKTLVADALPNNEWVRHITGPVTMQIVAEVEKICDLLENVELSQQPDTFTWGLTADHMYSAASAYGAMFFGSSQLVGAKHIWKTAAPPRVRFFFWLVMHHRCWTAERRWRHGLQDSNLCITCDQEAQTIDHILLGCCYSKEVWHFCLDRLHLQGYVVLTDEPALQWWLRRRKGLPKLARPGFDTLFFLIGWMLWKQRNARTFDGASTSAQQLAALIIEEAKVWFLAGYRKLGVLLQPMDEQ